MSTGEPREILPAGIAAKLRAMTPARVGIGRTGVSQHTRDVLSFQAAHAMARDAVHARLDANALAAELEHAAHGQIIHLHSAATSRAEYLQRPDLGRQLNDASRNQLAGHTTGSVDAVILVADGLSALAVERHAAPLIEELLPQLAGWKIAPICIVEQGRVAIGDEIGQTLKAQIAVVLIGERPGLSSPDSLGAYVTWQPRIGRTDAERICISNIRTEGLAIPQAAAQLSRILTEARRNQLTGVAPRAISSKVEG